MLLSSRSEYLVIKFPVGKCMVKARGGWIPWVPVPNCARDFIDSMAVVE